MKLIVIVITIIISSLGGHAQRHEVRVRGAVDTAPLEVVRAEPPGGSRMNVYMYIYTPIYTYT